MDLSAALAENFVNKVESKGCLIVTSIQEECFKWTQWGKWHVQIKLIQSLWKRMSAGIPLLSKAFETGSLLRQTHPEQRRLQVRDLLCLLVSRTYKWHLPYGCAQSQNNFATYLYLKMSLKKSFNFRIVWYQNWSHFGTNILVLMRELHNKCFRWVYHISNKHYFINIQAWLWEYQKPFPASSHVNWSNYVYIFYKSQKLHPLTSLFFLLES